MEPIIINNVKEIREWSRKCISNGESIGLIPTMGALHQGHASLVNKSLNENDKTVLSVFVNPVQFAPTEDLSTYPRTLKQDIELLTKLNGNYNGKKTHVDVIFAPIVTEMYPNGYTGGDKTQNIGTYVNVEGLSSKLEGKSRPQFFRGVTTVVTKLLSIVYPDRSYFGQKDVQQAIIVSRMVSDLLLPGKIIICSTIRDPSGLACSSRNVYLSTEEREKIAPKIYAALKKSAELLEKGDTPSEVIENIKKDFFNPVKEFSVDYFCISDPKTLDDLPLDCPIDSSSFTCAKVEDVSTWNVVISTAVRLGTTRLIDNYVI